MIHYFTLILDKSYMLHIKGASESTRIQWVYGHITYGCYNKRIIGGQAPPVVNN